MNRKDFIKFWAAYVRKNPDKKWSREQNVVVDGNIDSASMTVEQFLKMKRPKGL